MHLLENSIKIKKELYLVTSTRFFKFSFRKWVINGKTLKKTNNYKSHKFLNYSKSIKILRKSINLLLHKLKFNKQKLFFMTVLKNCCKLKVIWINLYKRVKTYLKEPNNFIKPVRKWTKNVVKSYDLNLSFFLNYKAFFINKSLENYR